MTCPSTEGQQAVHVLHCPVLHCSVLHCTVQYCSVLYSTAVYCTVLHCTVQHCTVHSSQYRPHLGPVHLHECQQVVGAGAQEAEALIEYGTVQYNTALSCTAFVPNDSIPMGLREMEVPTAGQGEAVVQGQEKGVLGSVQVQDLLSPATRTVLFCTVLYCSVLYCTVP